MRYVGSCYAVMKIVGTIIILENFGNKIINEEQVLDKQSIKNT